MHPALVELRNRGLIHQSTDIEVLSNLLHNKSSAYCGFDPTADSLHVGSLLALEVLDVLQKHGTTVLALLGGATASIGDPSFKNAERPMMNTDTIQANGIGITNNIMQYLGDRVTISNNLGWTKDMSVLDFMRSIGKHFSVNTMLAKDSVRSRIERPEAGISYAEFSYSLFQAMDFSFLHQVMKCSIQIGGSDQWGNMIAGVDLIHKTYGNDQKVGVLTFPLLTKDDGTKFGKSETGTVWLDPSKTSPYSFRQFWVNLSDAEALKCMKMFGYSETGDIVQDKGLFGDFMTLKVHGHHLLAAAKRVQACLKGLLTPDAELFDMLRRSSIPCISTESSEDGIDLVAMLVDNGLASSRKMAREHIANGAVSIGGTKAREHYDASTGKFSTKNAKINEYFVLRCGKMKVLAVQII